MLSLLSQLGSWYGVMIFITASLQILISLVSWAFPLLHSLKFFLSITRVRSFLILSLSSFGGQPLAYYFPLVQSIG